MIFKIPKETLVDVKQKKNIIKRFRNTNNKKKRQKKNEIKT